MQAHELAVDRDATARALDAWEASFDALVEDEAARLRNGAVAVLADVPPLGIAAAHAAGIPGLALANFSWDWIYRRMGFERAAERAARAYGRAHTLLALEPAAPMPAFECRVDLGTLGRTPSQDGAALRTRLGVEPDERLVLVAFREPTLCALPPPSSGTRYVRTDAGDAARRDVVARRAGDQFIDLVGAADVVVAKAGYGIIGDTAACGTRLLHAHREGFPEDEVLAHWLEARPGNARVATERLKAGDWLDELDNLATAAPPVPVGQAGVAAGVDLLASVLRG